MATKATKPLRTFRRALSRFRRREDGTSATEFAIIMPLFLLPAWFGMSEIAVMQERTTTLNTTTAMVADMVSTFQSPGQDTLDEVMTTAAYVLGEDADSPNFRMTVMGVVIPASNGDPNNPDPPYISWRMSNRSPLPPCGLVTNLPAGVATPTATDRTVIVADGLLNYSSPFDWVGSKRGEASTSGRLDKAVTVEDEYRFKEVESKDKQLVKDVLSKDERLVEIVEVEEDGSVQLTRTVVVGSDGEIKREVKVGKDEEILRVVEVGKKDEKIERRVTVGSESEVGRRAGLLRIENADLYHRSIYAPRVAANPIGPNVCPPPNRT